MIFSEVLSQCVMSNMIRGAIFKAGLINESYNLFSAFNEMYSATKILLLLNLLPNPQGIKPLQANIDCLGEILSLTTGKYFLVT